MTTALEGFTQDTFTADGKTKRLLRGGSGPAVIVISEMPGITPGVLGFARRVVALGCTATLPVLFGEPGKALSVPYGMKSILGGCVSREFSTMARRRTSPVTTWLRALARHEHERAGGPGVGVVGMCFTGGFALGMMVDDTVLAPVLSQPSLPFPVSRKHKADIGISDADLAKVKAQDIDVLGLRFTCDKLSPGERFATLERELGDRFVGVEIDSSEGNPHGIPKNAHSVLTEHLVDEPGHPTHDALQQVLDLFRTKLLASA